jgi:hypothetical protein
MSEIARFESISGHLQGYYVNKQKDGLGCFVFYGALTVVNIEFRSQNILIWNCL